MIEKAFQLFTLEEEIKAFTTQLKIAVIFPISNIFRQLWGLNELKKSMALENIVDTLSSNSLPPVIVISPANSNPDNLQHLLSDLKALPTVNVAKLDFALVKRLRYFITLGKRITYIIAILFGIGVILVIGNTIRLITNSKRQEIMILK